MSSYQSYTKSLFCPILLDGSKSHPSCLIKWARQPIPPPSPLFTREKSSSLLPFHSSINQRTPFLSSLYFPFLLSSSSPLLVTTCNPWNLKKESKDKKPNKEKEKIKISNFIKLRF